MTSLIRYDSQIKLVSSQLKEREQEAERAALESDRLRVELNEERLAHAAVRERFEQVRQPTASNCLSLPLIASHCLSLPLIASHCLSLPLIASHCLSLRFEQLRAHQEQIVQRSTVRCGVRHGHLMAS